MNVPSRPAEEPKVVKLTLWLSLPCERSPSPTCYRLLFTGLVVRVSREGSFRQTIQF